MSSTITPAGASAISNAFLTNTPLNISGIEVTDGTTVQATASIDSITTSTTNPAWKVITVTVKPGATAYWMRGLNLKASDGTVLATAVIPDSFVPSNTIYGAKNVTVQFVLNVGTSVNVTFTNTVPINAVTSDYVLGKLEAYAKLENVGNCKGVVRVDQNSTALTYQHVGKIVCLTMNAQTMFTLPTTGLKDGDRMRLVNYSVYTAIISGSLWTCGWNLNALDIAPGEALELVYDGTNALFVCVDGSGFLGSLASFGASTTANGWNKQPNGIIEQWGSATSNSSGLATFTLPIAFPNGVLSCVPSVPNGATPAYATKNSVSKTVVSAHAWSKGGGKLTSAVVEFIVKGY